MNMYKISKTIYWICILIILGLLIHMMVDLVSINLEFFEDGSFVLSGCLPWLVCYP